MGKQTVARTRAFGRRKRVLFAQRFRSARIGFCLRRSGSSRCFRRCRSPYRFRRCKRRFPRIPRFVYRCAGSFSRILLDERGRRRCCKRHPRLYGGGCAFAASRTRLQSRRRTRIVSEGARDFVRRRLHAFLPTVRGSGVLL